jgi:D-alanyl-lipoteichoic acid acyltransferase DltB (MBOAT superfamily)
MLFNSLTFLVFFVVVLALYLPLQRHFRAQNLLLLLASNVFYGTWNWKFLPLLWLTTLADFVVAIRVADATSPTTRRAWLTASLTFSLGMLGFFKYYNFGVESFAALLEQLGFTPHVSTLQVILPVGISFYTFQSIGYVLDVYRRERAPVRDLLNYALFVAYFPQLVAGPIQRANHLEPQLERPRRVTREDLRVGVECIVLGYFKKVAIADTLAPMVDQVFARPSGVSGIVTAIGVWAFALQIYGDFAGYSLIARGVSRLMGIDIIQNFRRPYLAQNPREFWERWHISLSTWLRDYLYISLGGSRRGSLFTYRNLMITMLLGGLWHGARWNFVLWGAYHGLLLVACHALGIGQKRERATGIAGVAAVAITFVLTLGGWLLFRADSMDQLGALLRNIATNFRWTDEVWTYLVPVVSLFALLLSYHAWQERRADDFPLLRAAPVARLAAYTFAILVVACFRFTPVTFIYFQF